MDDKVYQGMDDKVYQGMDDKVYQGMDDKVYQGIVKTIANDLTEDKLNPYDHALLMRNVVEYIISTCEDIADETAVGESTYGWMVGNNIRKHFGVEE